MAYRVYSSTAVYTEADAPLIGDKARDVQVIVQDDPDTGFSLETGQPYYVLRDGRWLAVDIFGLWDYLLDSGLVLFGRTINSEEYTAILEDARRHGEKSSWRTGERRP